MRIKLLLVAEVEVGAHPNPVAAALDKLDAFREAVQPSTEYGLTLWCASPDDVGSFTANGLTWLLGTPKHGGREGPPCS